MKTVRITIHGPCGAIDFVGIIHEIFRRSLLFLSPVDFYRRYSKMVPKFPHHEIEVVFPDRRKFRNLAKVHLHKSGKSANPFICFPERIDTEEKALQIFRVWCVGTVYTRWKGKNFDSVYAECQNNAEIFFRHMSGIGITIVSEGVI